MGKVAVVTDSSACLPRALAAEYGILSVPLRFRLNGRSYRDGVDISADEVYRRLPTLKALPTTSAPSPSDYYAVLHSAAAQVSGIVIITISSTLSGAYQSAVAATATASETLKHVEIQVIDSRTAAGAQGLVVLAAARAAARGGDVHAVVLTAREVMERVELVAFLDTLYYIARSGRVPMALHYTNALLKVNPLFHIRPMSGEAKTIRIARGRESAERQMLEIVHRRLHGQFLRGIVLHSDCRDEAERLRVRIESEFDCAELHVGDFTPAMGIHAGPRVLGLAYHPA
jgi:DegV family protein with EDD domain